MEIGESVVQSVIVHKVGNRLREESLVLAEQCFAITDDISNLILGGYLRGIVSSKNQYVLTNESDMALNIMAHHISAYFAKKYLLYGFHKYLLHICMPLHTTQILRQVIFLLSSLMGLKWEEDTSPQLVFINQNQNSSTSQHVSMEKRNNSKSRAASILI